MEKFLKGVGYVVIFLVVIVFIMPFIVMCGWFTGVILKFFCGDIIVTGLNLLFNTSRFTPEIIPYITATLSVFSSYLVTRDFNKKS